MSVWLNFYSERMQLMRDLGIMQLDEYGRWIDRPLGEMLTNTSTDCPQLPPSIPNRWWSLPDEVGKIIPEDIPPPADTDGAIHRLPEVSEETLPPSHGRGLSYPSSLAPE